MALDFSTTEKETKEHFVKALIYGAAGVGKTVLCSTAPKPIILNAEAGLLSLKDLEIPIPVININSIQDLKAAFEWVTENEKGKQFETICVDSLSEIAEQVLSYEKSINKDPRAAYGALTENIISMIKQFKKLDRNIIFLAKEQKVKDDTDKESMILRMPGQQLHVDLPYELDLVLHMEIVQDKDGKKVRALRTKDSLDCEAKDRSGALDELEQPNITKIFNKIKGEK